MSFLKSWATADRRVLLTLATPVIEVFDRHRQVQPIDCEAGGLLLGKIHGEDIAVEKATVPTTWDKRLRYFFERMPFGHGTIAQALWIASGGTTRYIGEWHTHPQDHPQPSQMDRSEWNKLTRGRADERPLLAIVVGRKSLYVELVPKDGIGPTMTPTEPL